MNQKICCVVAALALAACGQVEPLDGNRIVSLADAGPAPVRDAGAPTDAGVAKPDTGASDAGPRNDDHSDARVGGSRLAPGQGIAGVLDGDDDAVARGVGKGEPRLGRRCELRASEETLHSLQRKRRVLCGDR